MQNTEEDLFSRGKLPPATPQGICGEKLILQAYTQTSPLYMGTRSLRTNIMSKPKPNIADALKFYLFIDMYSI